MSSDPKIVWFDSDGPSDLARLGGKCRNLVALTRSGLPVPHGFAITVEMLVAFVDAVGLRERLERALIIGGPSIGDERAAELTGLFTQADMPSGLRRSILDAYERLGDRMGVAMPRVAVRSSATTEDLEKASGAGQQLTLLDVSGDANLIAAVLQCWASLFSHNALAYRRRRGLYQAGDLPAMAVGIQALVPARVSGVMFTTDPLSGDSSRIVVEAIGGLGEPLVGGEVTPDRHVIDKQTGRTIEQRISDKCVELAWTATSSIRREVPAERRRLPCLNHDDQERLLALARAVEAALGSDQDIEWAIDQAGRCFLLQARPITASGWASSPPEQSPEAARPRSALLGEMYRRWPGS